MEMYDVVIVGAGVTGSGIARALAKFCAKICVLEKNTDICEGTSKANSAIVHAGFDAEPGTRKAELNVRGNGMMEEIARELDVPFMRTGAMVVCVHREALPQLRELLDRGRENGVPGLKLLTGVQARALEPNLTPEVCGALLAERSGIICPFTLTAGFAENAAENGVEFRLGTPVEKIVPIKGGYAVETRDARLLTRAVVNAAGLYADRLHNMVCKEKIKISPRAGEYLLLDRAAGGHVARTIFQLPGRYGKGVLVTPTVHGNLLIGPTARDIADKEGINTTARGLAEVAEKAAASVKNLPMEQVITAFSGLRAHGDTGDFILGENAPCFFDAAGIESPGLTAAPAISELVADMVSRRLGLAKKQNFQPLRRGICHVAGLSAQERAGKIAENPAYGAIVCRCEEVSEGEILDAIRRPLGATTLDGVKRRTRAGAGRCQGGFCMPRVMEILAREQKKNLMQIHKNSEKSWLVSGETRPEGGEGK